MNFRNMKTINDLIKVSDTRRKIYVDMDGVLTDFEKAFMDLGYENPREYSKKKGEPALWKTINKETDHYWLNMDWMPDGKKLWNFLKDYDVELLTTPANSVKNCKEDKKAWARREIGDIKVNFSNKKEDFIKNKNTILIDDRDKNINAWKESGGTGILHKSADQTIKELKEILSEYP